MAILGSNLNAFDEPTSSKVSLLAPIGFVPSRSLRLARFIGYVTAGCCFGAACWPFLPSYPVLYPLIFILSWYVGWLLWQEWRQPGLRGLFAYTEQGWLLQANIGHERRRLQLTGAVLIWPSLVILPFRDIRTQSSFNLVIAADSVSSADFSRLRSWLRRYLVPKV